MRASKTLDFPDPLGPMMLVNLRKGPVKVYYSENDKWDFTEGFEVLNDQMVEFTDVREWGEVGGHVWSVELGHEEILRGQFGFAGVFWH